MALLSIQFPGHRIWQSSGPSDFPLTQPDCNLIQTGLLSEWGGLAHRQACPQALVLCSALAMGVSEGAGLLRVGRYSVGSGVSQRGFRIPDSGFWDLGGFALDLEQVARLQDPATNFCSSLPTHF